MIFYHDDIMISVGGLKVTTDEVEEMIAALQQFNADVTHIEAKEAKADLPKHIWQSVSAFSNTPKAGTLLLGIAERQRFQATGVQNGAKLQYDLACLCSDQMEPPVRPTISLHHVRGKQILSATFTELPSDQKPCYHKQSVLYKRRLHTGSGWQSPTHFLRSANDAVGEESTARRS